MGPTTTKSEKLVRSTRYSAPSPSKAFGSNSTACENSSLTRVTDRSKRAEEGPIGATTMARDHTGAIYPDLESKSVIVTGGGSGIGAAIVRAFVRQRARVGFIDIAEVPSKALVAELGGESSDVRFAKADIRDID